VSYKTGNFFVLINKASAKKGMTRLRRKNLYNDFELPYGTAENAARENVSFGK
jgi:hypothetical protein